MDKIESCPFCGGTIKVCIRDYEGNPHGDSYEENPWSGLAFGIDHCNDLYPQCPIANHDEEIVGTLLYDTREEAIESWNRRAKKTVWYPVSEPPQEPRDATNKWVWAIGAHRGTKTPVLWHEVHPYFHSHWTEMVVPEGPEVEDG